MKKYLLAIDQGTSSTRAIIFDKNGKVISVAQKDLKNLFPKPGWVEMNANDIWLSTLSVLTQVIGQSKIDIQEIASIGITNQRETTILWDKNTGMPLYNAIVWQSRQSLDICEKIKEAGYEKLIKNKTGLPVDAYFSASKIKWIIDNVNGIKEKIARDEVCFGTVDTWLLWNLSKDKTHATDYTNASRTMIYNIHTLEWDNELLDILNISKSILPEVHPSSYQYALTNPNHFFGYEIPISGMAGDQQAALFGQKCFEKGSLKNTYGTGCFLLMNTGSQPINSENGLITTIACCDSNEIKYALEGSIFVAGSAIQWLRDSLEIIKSSTQSEEIAKQVNDNGGVYVVPAFVGLGSPYWDMEAKASILGLTRGSTKHHIVRATLESIAYQSKDIVELMLKETNLNLTNLKVDGGASANDLLMQFQADILNVDIEVASNKETTALGAAFLAGLAANFYDSLDDIINNHSTNKKFIPKMSSEKRDEYYQKWLLAIKATQIFK